MPDNRARGLDFSSHQFPNELRLGEWRINPGLCFGYYRASIGELKDKQATIHGDTLRGTDYLTGCYHALHEAVSAAKNAQTFFSLQHTGNLLPGALDIERKALTRQLVIDFLREWLRLGGKPMTAYCSKQTWDAIVGPIPIPDDVRHLLPVLWIAVYPFDTPAGKPVPMDPVSVALRSTPPVNYDPAIPDDWVTWDIFQHSGQGSLPGYNKFIDLDVYKGTEAEMRARFGGAPIPPDPEPPDDNAAAIRAHANAILGLVG